MLSKETVWKLARFKNRNYKVFGFRDVGNEALSIPFEDLRETELLCNDERGYSKLSSGGDAKPALRPPKPPG